MLNKQNAAKARRALIAAETARIRNERRVADDRCMHAAQRSANHDLRLMADADRR